MTIAVSLVILLVYATSALDRRIEERRQRGVLRAARKRITRNDLGRRYLPSAREQGALAERTPT